MINNQIMTQKKHHYLDILDSADEIEKQLRQNVTPNSVIEMKLIMNTKLLALAGLANDGIINDNDIQEDAASGKYLQLSLDGKSYQLDAEPAKDILCNVSQGYIGVNIALTGDTETRTAHPPVEYAPTIETENDDSDFDFTNEEDFTFDDDNTENQENSKIEALEKELDDVYDDFESFADIDNGDEEIIETVAEQVINEKNTLNDSQLTFDYAKIEIEKKTSKRKVEHLIFKMTVAPINHGVRTEKNTPVVVYIESEDGSEFDCGVSSEYDPATVTVKDCTFNVTGSFSHGKFESNIDTDETGQIQKDEIRADKKEVGHIILTIEDIEVHVIPTSFETNNYIAYIRDSEENELLFTGNAPESFTVDDVTYAIDASWDRRRNFTAELVTGEDVDYIIEEAESTLEKNRQTSKNKKEKKKHRQAEKNTENANVDETEEKPVVELGFMILSSLAVVLGISMIYLYLKGI